MRKSKVIREICYRHHAAMNLYESGKINWDNSVSILKLAALLLLPSYHTGQTGRNHQEVTAMFQLVAFSKSGLYEQGLQGMKHTVTVIYYHLLRTCGVIW